MKIEREKKGRERHQQNRNYQAYDPCVRFTTFLNEKEGGGRKERERERDTILNTAFALRE